jgi:hypothetical protein
MDLTADLREKVGQLAEEAARAELSEQTTESGDPQVEEETTNTEPQADNEPEAQDTEQEVETTESPADPETPDNQEPDEETRLDHSVRVDELPDELKPLYYEMVAEMQGGLTKKFQRHAAYTKALKEYEPVISDIFGREFDSPAEAGVAALNHLKALYNDPEVALEWWTATGEALRANGLINDQTPTAPAAPATEAPGELAEDTNTIQQLVEQQLQQYHAQLTQQLAPYQQLMQSQYAAQQQQVEQERQRQAAEALRANFEEQVGPVKNKLTEAQLELVLNAGIVDENWGEIANRLVADEQRKIAEARKSYLNQKLEGQPEIVNNGGPAPAPQPRRIDLSADPDSLREGIRERAAQALSQINQ